MTSRSSKGLTVRSREHSTSVERDRRPSATYESHRCRLPPNLRPSAVSTSKNTLESRTVTSFVSVIYYLLTYPIFHLSIHSCTTVQLPTFFQFLFFKPEISNRKTDSRQHQIGTLSTPLSCYLVSAIDANLSAVSKRTAVKVDSIPRRWSTRSTRLCPVIVESERHLTTNAFLIEFHSITNNC